MKTLLGVIVMMLISTDMLFAQDTSSYRNTIMEMEKMELQPEVMSTIQPTPTVDYPEQYSSLKEINDALLSLIKTYDSRDTVIMKFIDHEQAMSPKQIMKDRLLLIETIMKKYSVNKRN